MAHRTTLVSVLAVLTTACAHLVPANPREGPVVLAAEPGYEARLLWRSEVGVWTVGVHDLLERYAGLEIVALDDRGRCAVLVQNSGKTTPLVALEDGTWLGGLASGDVDPRRPGEELYVGAQRGNLYQVVAHEQGGFDANVIAYFPGREVHSLLSVQLDDDAELELVCGLSTGEVLQLAPPRAPGEAWTSWTIHGDPGRVRQMIAFEVEGRPRIALVSRSGRASILTPTPTGFRETILHRATQGLARLCASTRRVHAAPILYAIGDQGEVLRFVRGPSGVWSSETIHLGPTGGRGIAADVLGVEGESVAIFGYSGTVELLTRAEDGAWSAAPIFQDRDKGHWLVAAELDDRTPGRELVVSGYSGDVVTIGAAPR